MHIIQTEKEVISMLAKGSEVVILPAIFILAISMFIIPVSLYYLILFGFGLFYFSFCLFFFRDPNRYAPDEIGIMVAPVDGKVVEIKEVNDEIIRIQIQISVFNVHVNRMPIDSKVISIRKLKGTYWPIWFNRKYDEVNARQHFTFETKEGFPLRITQISGILAWRCVSYVKIGEKLKLNKKFGLIRFGSAMRIEFPKSSKYLPIVFVNQKLKSGETIIARREKSN